MADKINYKRLWANSNSSSGGTGVQSVNSGTDITVDNTDPQNPIINFTGNQDNITVVANYSALPNPTTVSGKFYWASASQGTQWLPGILGGTYYNSGLYYSNGVSWEYMETPYQATQVEVNTGTNTDKFVTPDTFTNASKWTTKQSTVLTDSHILVGDGSNIATDVAMSGDITIGNTGITTIGASKVVNSMMGLTWTTFSSTITGFSGTPTQNISYCLQGKLMFVSIDITGTSNATSFTFTIPSASSKVRYYSARVTNNSATVGAGFMVTGAASTTVTCYTNSALAAWSNMGTKGIDGTIITIELQ